VELLFLGTSSGTPTHHRNVSALAVLESEGRGWHLVDCGEGTQHRLLRTPLSLHELRAIHITHVHGDHCFGLPGLLASAALQGRQRPLDLVLPPQLGEWLLASLRVSHSHLGYELRLHASEDESPRLLGQLQVRSVPLTHRVPCWGYRFEEHFPSPRLDVERLRQEGIAAGESWGQLARGQDVIFAGRHLRAADYRLPGRPPRCLVVAGDNGDPARLAEACQGASALVHEATYLQALADARPELGHSGARAVAEFAERSGLPNLVLSHFSPRYGPPGSPGENLDDLRAEAAAVYSGQLLLAEDLLHLRLDRAGQLHALPT